MGPKHFSARYSALPSLFISHTDKNFYKTFASRRSTLFNLQHHRYYRQVPLQASLVSEPSKSIQQRTTLDRSTHSHHGVRHNNQIQVQTVLFLRFAWLKILGKYFLLICILLLSKEKIHINVVVIGHVDSGKSTTTGTVATQSRTITSSHRVQDI